MFARRCACGAGRRVYPGWGMKPKDHPNATAAGITGAVALCITGTLRAFGVEITPELAVAYVTVGSYLVLRFAPARK